jgi:hypothetical protein
MKTLEHMAKECDEMASQAAARKAEQAQMTEKLDRMLKPVREDGDGRREHDERTKKS